MPSKRTNDSVDRILQDLNRRQAEEGVRDTVTDHQVDEILRSVGITTTPLYGTQAQDSQIAFSDDLLSLDERELDEWSAASSQRPAAPATASAKRVEAPAQPKPTPVQHKPTPVQHTEAPAQPKPTPAQPKPQTPAPRDAQADQAQTAHDDTLGDTTRTGIIKNFLLKMAPDGSDADADALNQGKNQFKKFFEDSVAVVPGEKKNARKSAKKRRGLFGLKSVEDTDEFVPINVSLGASPSESADETPDAAPQQEEFYPNAEPEETFEPAPKKRGFLSGLFGAHASATEEIYIPEEQQSDKLSAPSAAPSAAPSEPAPAAGGDTDTSQDVWHSKYTRRAEPAADIEFTVPRDPEEADTTEMVRLAVNLAMRESTGASTTFRKKRNTVEFIPGQKSKPARDESAEEASSVSEPVGEPIELPKTRSAAPSGFTMQLGSLEPVPSDSTQEFMSAYNAVRRAPKAAPAEQEPTPVEPAAQEPTAEPAAVSAEAAEPTPTPARVAPYPGGDPNADTVVVCLPDEANAFPAAAPFGHRPRDEVDELVDTLTGHASVHVENDGEPAHTGFTQELSPAEPSAHTGFTQELDGTAAPAPASGFTQHFDAEPGEPGEHGTASFVRDIADSINAEDAADAAQYDDAARRLMDTDSDLDDSVAPKAHVHRAKSTPKAVMAGLRLTGKAADEEPDAAEAPFDTAELPPVQGHEYERPEDAPAVSRTLNAELLRLTTACLVTGSVAAVLLLLGFMAAASVLPSVLTGERVYPAVALVLLLVACGICRRTMLSGLRGLAAQPTPDTAAALPAVAAAVQCVVLLAVSSYSEKLTLLAGPAALILCMHTVGRRMSAASENENFSLVSANVDHAVAYRLKDPGALHVVTQGLAEPRPYVLVSRPTLILRNFLAHSAVRDTFGKTGQQLCWLAGGCSLAGMLFTLIRTKDAASAVTIMASICCLCAPLASTLYAALPARMMQRSAAQIGAVVPGWHDIRSLGRINVIQVTARDLFPTGSVSLAGIKPVKPEHIDLAIVYAASILADAGPTLRDVFLGMLGDNRSLLAEVTDRETVSGKGYVGWIRKRRVLVGNRTLMQDYGVKIPGLEYERHHTVNQRRVIYLAVSGKLFAMFQVAYQRDADTAAVLDGLRREGLSLIVDCDDFNCDEKLLETAYGLPAGTVKVLNAAERTALAPSVQWLPESDGSMLHLGSFASFVGGLEAAAGAAEGEKRSSAVVSVSMLFGCVMGVLFTLTGGLLTLPLPAFVLYQAAWCVLALFFPLTQRY